MIHQVNGSDACHSVGSQMELELLAVLLEPEDATYPWNPADAESAAYFDELEQQFAINDLLDEELTTRASTFYNQLDTLWSEVEISSCYNYTTSNSVLDQLQESLPNLFVSRLPQGWINTIASKAGEIFTSSQSLAEQLAECVQTVLPTLVIDDLSVLTRPYAYAMRSREPQSLTSVINNVENQEWADLSEIEQAKVSVAIAYYVLRQLDDSQPEA